MRTTGSVPEGRTTTRPSPERRFRKGPLDEDFALRENGATYWVVNTILDSLSNETMLAIAKGLKPLPRGK